MIRLPSDAVMLKAGKALLLIDPTVYSEFDSPMVIDGPRWVKDSLLVLELGNYVLLKLPFPTSILFPVPEKALNHITNAIKSLDRRKRAVYKTLDIGPPLTTLRNALIEICNALKKSGLG